MGYLALEDPRVVEDLTAGLADLALFSRKPTTGSSQKSGCTLHPGWDPLQSGPNLGVPYMVVSKVGGSYFGVLT